MKKNQVAKLSTILGIIEPIFYFLLITVESFARDDYKLHKNYISELSGSNVTNQKRLNLYSFILLGAVVMMYSFSLHEYVKKHPLTPIAESLIVISGASLILLGLIPADGKKPTKMGQWHRRITGPAAIGIPAAMICYYYIFKADKRWKKFWPEFSLILGNLILITDALLYFRKPKKIIGLVQRLGMGFALLWVFATSTKSYSLQQH